MKYRLLALLTALLLLNPAHGAEKSLTFIHVNDVYELQPRQGLGGVAFLATLLKEYRLQDPQLAFTFGGDLLSPSWLSGMSKGSQMIEAMNALGLDVAVPGNHEFDFGAENMLKQIGASHATWLAANMSTPEGSPLPSIRRHLIREMNGVKVGFFGVITPQTATTSKPGNQVIFTPFLENSRKQVAELKAEGAQLIVALSHLLLSEDRQLAAEVKGIDLILGGHDHDPIAIYEQGVLIVKSGSDAQYISIVKLITHDDQPGKPLHWQRAWQVRPVADVVADPSVQSLVTRWQKGQDEALDISLSSVPTAFNSLQQEVRTRENALANLIADAMCQAVGAEVALFNGGGLRGNRNYPAGYAFTPRDILTELPFGNVTVLLEINGLDLLTTLESALSQVENAGGRFPHVAGMKVSYDPGRPAGQRVVSVQVGEAPLDLKKSYKLATTDYLASGKDGYAALLHGTLLIDASAATLLADQVKQWLLAHQDWQPRLDGRMTKLTAK